MEQSNSDTQKFMFHDRSFNYADDSGEKFHLLPKSENNKTTWCSLCDCNWAKSISYPKGKIASPFHNYIVIIYFMYL